MATSATSPQQYQTKTGDTVDSICFAFYGNTDGGQVEATLAANRDLGLGDIGPTLPAGLVLTLPVVSAPSTATISLFS